MHAQQAPEDLTAERQQLAQLKAELDAREKALDNRERLLAEKEGATENSAVQSPEKRKAKDTHKQQQTIAQSHEAKANGAPYEKKLRGVVLQRLGGKFLEKLAAEEYVRTAPSAP